MTYERRAEIYMQAIAKYGAEAQTRMAIEEMSELTKEICKLYRGEQNHNALTDEIADVTIMMEQLRLVFGVNDEVEERVDYKARRLRDRMDCANE